ncbi:MAG TPA: Gldg family protein [Nitrospiria bacterium]|nr:Gldg family protein [Nitrospiria bacterium]
MAVPVNIGWLLAGGAVLAAAAGLTLDFSFPGRWYALAGYGTAAALLVGYAVAARRQLGSWGRRRSTRMGAHSALLAIVVGAILVMVNVLVVRHPARLDLSQTGTFTLAPQSEKVLVGLKDDVKVTAFVQKGSETEAKFKDLLDTYRHYSQKLSSETVDPDTHPAAAKQYGITKYDTIVLEGGGRETRIQAVSEQDLTNALIRLGKTEKKRIAVLEGHGEPSLTDPDVDGLSQAKDALERQGYEVAPLFLAQTGSVDAGTDAVIVADPKKPLLRQELDALKAYVSGGGRLLLLAGPGPKTGVDELAAQWGVTFREDTVIDPVSRLFGGDYTTPVIRTYGDHEIVKDFRLATFFPLAQSLTFQPSPSAEVDYRVVALSSPESWGETQIVGGKARFDRGQDAQGPLDLVAALAPTSSAAPGESESKASRPAWRVVVSGNARFATNGFFNLSGNGDLLVASINWLAEDQDLIAIRPKEASSIPVILTAGQERVVRWVPTLIVPGVIAGYGFAVWRRRRRL